jgi:DNA ligase 1
MKNKKITLPTLFKRTSTGAIEEWRIWTEDNKIYTEYGQVGGKIQQTSDTIHSGKNIGRSNETNAIEQAQAEAKSYWTKKKKKSYVEDFDRAQQGEDDITGGSEVMLAHVYSKHGHKITYPAYLSPKLDGVRMVAVVENGECSLWTRTRKPITSLPHIIEAIENLFPHQSIILDGETYNHDLKHDFEGIVSIVRQEDPDEYQELIQYHIFDMINNSPYSERLAQIHAVIPKRHKLLKIVNSFLVNNEEDAMECFERFRDEGYEGAMIRNAHGLYVGKRSYDLQKIKEFLDAEFGIVGYEEGRGKLTGHIGAFLVQADNGSVFKAKMSGAVEQLKIYFDEHDLWRDKKLVVQYQGLSKYGVPRFPVGIRLRDDEDY